VNGKHHTSDGSTNGKKESSTFWTERWMGLKAKLDKAV